MDSAFVKNYVEKIALEFETRDIFSIAEKAGISIIYEDWFPVTIGEFERKTKTIRVNSRALKNEKTEENKINLRKKIIAHELGHFFAAEFDFDKKQEEKFACDFAEEFNKNNSE